MTVDPRGLRDGASSQEMVGPSGRGGRARSGAEPENAVGGLAPATITAPKAANAATALTLSHPTTVDSPPLSARALRAKIFFSLLSSVSPIFIPSYLTDGGVKRDPGSLAPDVNVLDVGPGAGTLCLAPGSTLPGRATWPILPSFLPFCLPPHPPARPRARPRRRCHPHPPPSRPLLAPPSPPLLTPPCHAHEHFGNSATSILPPSFLLLTRARSAGSADAGDPDAATRHHQ